MERITDLSPHTSAAVFPHVAADRSASLVRYISRQRWYKGRAEAPISAELIAVAACGPGVSWAVAKLIYPDRSVELYNLPLCVCGRDQIDPDAVLFADAPGKVVADAVHHPAARRRLLEHLIYGKPQLSTEGVWSPQCYVRSPDLRDSTSSLLRGEQSNTSFISSAGLIVKLFRRLQDGSNPDVELGHFLTLRKGLAQVPQLHASLRLKLLARPRQNIPSMVCDAAMVQQLIPDAVDGWSAVLGALGRWLEDRAPAAAPPWIDQVRALGRATRTVHEALADVDAAGPVNFLPRAVTKADIAGWKAAAAAQTEAACAALRQHRPGLRGKAAQLADRLLHAYDSAGGHALLQALLPPLRQATHPAGEAVPWGRCIRHHGDYHLGQVLQRSPTEFVLLDFEGEPLRPLDERRRLHSPLRDVAGMLRSLNYASYSAAEVGEVQKRAARQATDRWLKQAQGAFLVAYEAPPAGAESPSLSLLPRQPERRAYLLALFVAEKAFYEVCYELAHRPKWVVLPLTALCAALPSEPS
jgi:trehalose synthase-fused probable maltokinase